MTLPSQLVICKHVSPLLYRLGGAGPWQIHIQEPKRPRDKRFFACHVCHLRLVLGQEKGAATGDQPFVQAACACFLSTACGENTCTLLLLHKHMSVVGLLDLHRLVSMELLVCTTCDVMLLR